MNLLKNIKAQSLPKKLIFTFLLLLLIGMGVWFVMGDVNFTPVYPIGNITTSENYANFSTNITLDGSDNIINLTSIFNGVTTIEKDSSLLVYFNMNNISTLSCQTGYENDTCMADITNNGNDAKIINKGIYNYGKYDNGYSVINHVNTTMEYLNFTSPFKDVTSSNFTVSFQAQMFPTIQNDKAIGINLLRWVGVGYFNMYSGRTTRTFAVNMNLKNTTGSNKDFGCGTSNLTQLYDKQWHQFVYSWNNETKTVKIYIDGILSNTCQDTDSSHTSFFGTTPFNDLVNSYVGSFPNSFATLNNLAINGSIDELKIWNRTLSDSEIATSFPSYLKRYNATNYEYFNNYSLNYSSKLINSTNPIYQNNYSLCVINSSSITTCFLQNITQVLKTINLISNFSEVTGILSDYRFGFNVHSASYFISDSQYLWHQQKWEEIPSSKFARIDQNLDSFFTGGYNFDLEDFYNISKTYVGNAGGVSEVAQGWGVSWQFGNGTAGRTTDAHSGNYSLFLNSTGGTLYIDKGEKSTSLEDDIFIEPNHQYNISFWVKGQGTISSGMQLQYGAYPTCGSLSSTSANSTDWIQYSYLCNAPSDLNSSTYRFTLNINSWGNITFDDWNITDTATGTYPEFWLKDSSLIQYWQDRFDYLFSTGSMPEIITSYMAKFMANFSGYCYNVSDSSRDYGDCPPKNNDLYGRVNKYWWDLITENGTRYNMSKFADESFNEPEIGFFMDMLSGGNILKTQPYIDMANGTFFYMNKSYPQVILLAPAVAGDGCKVPENYYMINASITNFSGVYPTFQLAGHCYQHDLNYGLLQGTDRIANLYTALGKTFNGVWWDEYNFGWGGSGDNYANWIKNTSSRFNEWENYIVSDTIRMMSKYPNYSHVGVYQWTDNCVYGVGCGEYPTRYSSVSSPAYENTTYPEYWVVANLSMVCQDEGNVFNTYSESSEIPIISCNKGNQYGIAVTNDLNESRVIPINLSMNNGTIKYPYNNITNLKTKEIYPIIGSVLTLTIDAKQTYYLSSGIPPTITQIQPINLTYNQTSSVNFSANLTDDVGLTNSTLNIMNTSDNTLIQNVVNYVSGEISVIQSWLITLADGVYHWWISLFDDEGKETISGNYTLYVQVSSNITFQSPTPTNSSEVIISNQTITANISDSPEQNTSSWIDMDRSVVGYWSFDYSNSTHILDNSTYGNNALFSGGLGISNISLATRGNGINFDGVENRLNISYSQSLNFSKRTFTLSLWVNPTKGSGQQNLITSWNTTHGWTLDYDSGFGQCVGDKIGFFDGDDWHCSGAIPSSTWNNSQWKHIIVTVNKTHYSFYLDGEFNKTGTMSMLDDTNNKIILGLEEPLDDAYIGSMDEVIFFNRTLSESEVKSLYDSQSNLFNASFIDINNGWHNYTLNVIDSAGSYAKSYQTFLQNDSVKPTFTITPAQNYEFGMPLSQSFYPLTISATTSDSNLNISSCKFTYANGTTYTNMSWMGNYSLAINLTSYGNYQLYVNSTDKLGNFNEETRTFRLTLVSTGTGEGSFTSSSSSNITNITTINNYPSNNTGNNITINNNVGDMIKDINNPEVTLGDFVQKYWILLLAIILIILILTNSTRRKDK